MSDLIDNFEPTETIGVRDKYAVISTYSPPPRSFVPVLTDWRQADPAYGVFSAVDKLVQGKVATKTRMLELQQHPLTLLETEDTVERRFRQFLERWTAETVFVSSLTDVVYHLDFQRIIGLGSEVVPHILARLRDHPVPFFYALKVLVPDEPVSDDAGVQEAVDRWLAWGRERGLVA